VLSEGRVLQADALPLPLSASETGTLSFKALKAQAVAEFESNYIRRLLIENNGNITRAAMVAKKNRRAFWQLMHKHHIQPRSHASSTDTPGQLPARARTNLS
jgi:two-component system response regulator GlrR